jgi:hypothetical protein
MKQQSNTSLHNEKNLNDNEVDEIANNALKRAMIRMLNKDLYKHLN